MSSLSPPRILALVAQLELDVGEPRICYACLSFVAFPLEDGDRRGAAAAARRMTPELWHEGLCGYAFAVVRQAAHARVPDAAVALADLEDRGGRSPVARAIVMRLAEQLNRRARTELCLEEAARPRLALAPPELN
jgi:hypothetical protein